MALSAINFNDVLKKQRRRYLTNYKKILINIFWINQNLHI